MLLVLPGNLSEIYLKSHLRPGASLIGQLVKNPPAMQETWVQSLGWEDPWRRARILQSFGLENSMDCIVHGVTQSWT